MAYIGSSPTKVVSRQSANIFTYTATANQTAFTGADANGNTLACTPSDIMVHMNGIKLEESDYTASTTTVTLGSGAAAGDEITITAFVTFETADAYTKSASDTRYVNTTGDTMTGNLGIGAAPSFSTLEVTADKTTANNLQLTLRGSTNTNKQMIMGFDTTDDKSFITSQIAGTAQKPLVINSSAVTMPSQPGFQVSGNFGWRDYGSTYTEVTDWRSNQSGYYNSGMFSNATGRATAPVAGTYLFNFVVYTNNSGDASHYGHPAINGSSFGDAIMLYSSNDTNYPDNTVAGSYQISLGANDYVSLIWRFDIYGYHSHFSGHLIG